MSEEIKEYNVILNNEQVKVLVDELKEKGKEIERLNKCIKDDKENANEIIVEQQQEIERLNNIIKRLEEFIEKEIEIYTLELTEKNTNALSYSLPIKAVYKEIYNVLQELKGSDKE